MSDKDSSSDEAGFYLELLRAYFDSANDAIFVLCDEMKFLICNKMTQRWLGYSEQQLTEHNKRTPVTEFLGSPDTVDHFVASFRRVLDNEDVCFETLINPAAGKQRWVEISMRRVDIEDGDMVIAVARDISQRKLREEQSRRAQKINALGKLTGGIAHDFNNILGVVIGYAELLTSNFGNREKLEKYSHEILRASRRGARLTGKLLAFSRQNVSSDTDCLDINALLLNQQFMLEKALTVRVQLVFDLAEELWLAKLDAGHMEDALLNISINAMHAIEDKGQLVIRTHNQLVEYEQAEALEIRPGDYVVVTFDDNGCGMDQATRDKIFEPFYSTKGQLGTGLGLSQVYSFIKRSRGAITVESEPGEGARFSLYFPRCTPGLRDMADDQQTQHGDTVAGNSASILLVDDEVALLDLNREILEQHGYRILTADNADAALAILEDGSVDLIISDVLMPEIDGYQLAGMVRERYPDMKIMLVSGYTDDRDADYGVNSQQYELMEKPFDTQELLQKIRQMLDQSSQVE